MKSQKKHIFLSVIIAGCLNFGLMSLHGQNLHFDINTLLSNLNGVSGLENSDRFHDPNRISVVQNGNKLTITYRSYGFNNGWSWNGTDGSHWVVAHTWGIFDTDPTTTKTELVCQVTISDNIPNSMSYTWKENQILPFNSNIYQIISGIQPFIMDADDPNEHYSQLQERAESFIRLYTYESPRLDYLFSDETVNRLINKVQRLNLAKTGGAYETGQYISDAYSQSVTQIITTQLSVIHTVGHKALWVANNGNFQAVRNGGSTMETFRETIDLTPDTIGKTYLPISYQKGKHEGTISNYDKWGFFYGDEFVIANFLLATPTSRDGELNLNEANTWRPEVEGRGETHAYEAQYKIEGRTGWIPASQEWPPPGVGKYVFQVRLRSLDPNWNDSKPSQDYTLSVHEPVIWESFDNLIRDWYDVGDWAPAPPTIPYGQKFTQTKVQKQDRRKGKRWLNGPQKGVEFDTEDYTREEVRNQPAIGLAEQWEAFDILVRDWYDVGGWTPDADTILAGEAFTQTKQQAQDWRSGEWCVLGPVPGAERHPEDHEKTRTQSQPAIGTMEVWNPVYWWNEWYPVSEWMPDASLYLTTQTFEQTIQMKRDQYMREVSNISNVRKDNTYIQSEYKSESRIVQGARQPEANVTIGTKAPEIEIQSNSTKGSGQYYIIPD
jgi:hypothetical protein